MNKWHSTKKMSEDPIKKAPDSQTNRNCEKKSKITRQQRFAIIISCIIASIVAALNITNVIEPYFGTFSPNAILIAIVLGLLVWAFWLPSRKTTSKIFNYYMTSLPMIFALTIIYLVNELQQIPELRAKIDPLFSVGMWFVVISTLTALVAMMNTDQRIDKLEKRLLPEENSEPSTPKSDNNGKTSLPTDKWNRASQIATIVSAVALLFAGGALYYNYNEEVIIEKQFKIENFDPVVYDLRGGDVEITANWYPMYNITNDISISASTNHNLVFSIGNVTISDVSKQGKCFFDSLPTVRYVGSSYVIFGRNHDVVNLKPDVYFDYTTKPAFSHIFGNQSAAERYSLATIKFDIKMDDLQDKTKKPVYYQDASDMFVKLPHKEYNDAITNCSSSN